MFAHRATASDIPHLVALMDEFYAEANYPLDHAWATASFTALLANDSYGAIWLVSQGEGQFAGYIVLTLHFSMEYGGLCGIIDDLFVRPTFRRQGAAGVAIEALVQECRQRKALAVQVETGLDNTRAQTLYQRHGLQPRTDQRQTFTLHLTPDALPASS